MNFVVISIGSNNDRYINLSKSKAFLQLLDIDLKYSEYLETTPYGTKYPEIFLNQLVALNTNLSYCTLSTILKDVEKQLGRSTELESRGYINIDLDIIQFNDTKYKHKDWDRNYVKDLLDSLRREFILSL